VPESSIIWEAERLRFEVEEREEGEFEEETMTNSILS